MMKKIQTLSGVLALAVLLLFPLATWAQTFGGGSGSANDPYLIKTKEHFNELVTSVQGGNDYAGKFFLQAANIDLGGATIKPFELNAMYLGGYYTLGNFKLEIPENVTEVVLFNMLGSVTLDKITVIQPKDEEKKDKKLENLTKFRFAVNAFSVAFRNVNAELDFGSRKTALLNFLFSENTGNAVFENCKISAKVEFAETLGGDVVVQFAGPIDDFVLLNGDLDVEVVKGDDFTGNVTLSASLVGAVYDAVLAGKRAVNVTGTGAGTVVQTGSDAAVTTVNHWLLYAKEAYSDVNKVCADGGAQPLCLELSDAELKMDVATARTTKVNSSILIYEPYPEMARFLKGQYPAPRWYRETARYQRALPSMLKNTPDTPFEIETPADFIIAAEHMEELQFVKQTANIDFAAYGESIMYPQVPAGKTLEYDGGGYKISGFGYNLSKESALSAFALFTDGKIRNVVLEGAKVVVALENATKGNYACLALAPDELSNCTLNNCALTINNTGSSNNVNAALLAVSMAEKGGEKCTDVAINNSKLTLNGNDLYGNFAAGFASLKAQEVRGLIADGISISFNGEAEANNICLGGLVALSETAKIAKCGVSGTIKTAKKASQMAVGGFVGSISDESKIEKCYAKVNLDTDKVSCSGGFAGESTVASYTISDSYVNTQTFKNAGGDIAGFMGKTEVDKTRTAFENCYTRIANWKATPGVSSIRPFATYPAGVTDPSDLNDFLKNCYFNIVSGYPDEDAYKAITAKKHTNMSTPSAFTDWDFDDTWMIAGEAPILQWEPLVPWKPEGDGSEKNPYLIATLNNLRWVSENTDIWEEGLYYKQIADIDATESKTWNKKDDKFQGFRPIGSNAHEFSGQYDGGNKIIKNLFIGFDKEEVGFFGYVNTASDIVLSKIWLENLKIKAGDAAQYVGGLVGRLDDGSGNVKIFECHASLDSIVVGSGAQYVGGFVGYADYTSTFQIASATAAHAKSAIVAKAGTVGGFAGSMESDNGTMQKLCTNLNVVEAEGGSVNTMGGFVGYINGGVPTVLQNAYSLGNVNFRTAAAIVGAFVGKVDGSTKIQTTYTAGKVQDINGTEPVLKPDAGFGGDFSGGTLSQNYYQKKQGDKEITSPGFDGADKCTALDKAKLQSGNVADMPGFSTVDWKFEAGKYPELLGMEPPKKGTVTVNKTGAENGTISVTVGDTEVTSGNSYTVGTVVKIMAKANDTEKFEARVSANGTALTLSGDECTYTVVEGNNTINVSIVAKGTPEPGAVSDAVFAGVVVAPNPFGTELRILNNEAVEGRYELLTIQGMVVRAGVLEPNTMVETSDLASGIYFVRFSATNGVSKVVKVVKQ